MTSSKWEKRNNTVLYTGIAISAAVVGIATLLFDSPEQERNVWTMILVTVVGLGSMLAAFFYARRNPNVMSRVLKLKYEAAEFALRKAFKGKHIRFRRQQDDEGLHLFEFPGNSLEMQIYSYDPENGVKGAPAKVSSLGMPLSATLVTIRGVNSKNQKFAELLSELIDQMAD